MARFIHQAMVRRSVIVKLIETMKRKGHRAYKRIDMNEVIAKSAALPKNDVPPEIIRLLPLNDLQDNIDLQNDQTPVPTAGSVEEACDLLDTKKINALENERSTGDEVDINARQNTVLQHLVETEQNKSSTDHVRTERVEVKNCNAMIYEFAPWYFGGAFAFFYVCIQCRFS